MDAVIVTHNSSGDLGELMRSAPLASAFDRVIVVDNASSDDTVTVARTGDAHVVPRAVNTGFGAGANVGARLTSGDAFALLNPDITFQRIPTAERLMANFDDRRVGLVVPSMRLPDGALQDSMRVVPTPVDLVARRLIPGQERRGRISADIAVEVPWAVAACWFVDRAWFKRLGGFNERYFLYFEDVDFCVRLAKLGGVVRFDPEIVVEHRHHAESRKAVLGWPNRQHIRSAARFFRTHPEYLLSHRSRISQ